MKINEDLNRIKDIMGVITEDTSGYSKKSIFYGINSLNSWLHQSNGFGLANYINKRLESLKSNISDEDIKKYELGASYLLSGGKINKSKYDWFVRTLADSKLVFVDGEWHPSNKLNTNYSQLATVLTDVLLMSFDKGDEDRTKDILDVINTPKGDIKEIFNYHKDFIYNLIDTFLPNPKDLLNYTDKITKWSDVGEGNEDLVADILNSKGYEILYQGGNGDFIDMKFGIDLIVKSPKGNIQTIQVKTSERQATSFLKMSNRYAAVDFVTYQDGDKFISKKLR